ncbi:hypothetical protein LUX12_15140 [Streptomyces somaliensis]|uniref:hypothetical protein n=1 Tax=Streptomyces somaliensis TaxID=78355 RepID=UPI0020CC5E42|nr:hypothetical protein [Streptomyces somaliensis]MCP9945825.1 hypothetical protein [Streptomyces somaliensis]MCP9961002.1 hypothetical protein [Streptomyces somaliensis]MCP9973787.1 hypothetical protein [Streptomyces somaliensis]
MPETTPTPRVCRDCDGFATATITTGLQAPDGSRATLRVACPTCRGTGRTTPAVRVRVGK